MENNQIEFRAEFIIEDGKIEEYKKLIQGMSKMVEVNEPNTTTFQFYLDRSETKCIELVQYLFTIKYNGYFPSAGHKSASIYTHAHKYRERIQIIS